MLDNKGFDLWANGYDKSVNLSQSSNTYPFAGYKTLLNKIYREIKTTPSATVLDIGFGTGVLAQKLYAENYTIYGIDFSQKMIDIAKQKMPNANLIRHDFSFGLPEQIKDKKFDYIVCTYAIHHLTDKQKLVFIADLLNILSESGKILIGDVAFETKIQLEKCKAENLDEWDNDEIYPVLEIFKENFPNANFEKTSFCSGIISFSK